MSSHGRSGGALIRPQHRNLISNKNHNCNASTTLADLLTPLPVANPFLAMRATLVWWLGDKFEDGLPHGW